MSRFTEEKSTNYVIISKPAYVQFICPYCGNEIEIPFEDVAYNTNYWGDGAFCTCPECDEEVELDDYEYS